MKRERFKQQWGKSLASKTGSWAKSYLVTELSFMAKRCDIRDHL